LSSTNQKKYVFVCTRIGFSFLAFPFLSFQSIIHQFSRPLAFSNKKNKTKLHLRMSNRALWRHYNEGTKAIVFIVDSNDRDRIDEASEELKTLLTQGDLNESVLLVLANKQDLDNAMSVEEISDRLGLSTITSHRWTLRCCSAVSGQGIIDGFEWLANNINWN
jgi:hypothetical protein